MRKAVAKWFRANRKEEGVTLEAVSQRLGISRAALSHFEINGAGYKTALKHAQTLGWEIPSWEELLSSLQSDTFVAKVTISSATARMGNLMETEDRFEEEILSTASIPREFVRKHFPRAQNLNKLALLPNTRGDSMLPTLKARDTLLVDCSVTKFEHSGIYVFSSARGLMIKRVFIDPLGRGVTLISDNKEYPSVFISSDEEQEITVHAFVLGKWSFTNFGEDYLHVEDQDLEMN